MAKLPLIVNTFGGECFQFFSRNPYGGKVIPLDPDKIARFKENCQKAGIKNYYIHAPYYINLASLNNKIFYGSVKSIQVDIERAEQLGAKYVITHIGSAKDFKRSNDLFAQKENSVEMSEKFAPALELMSQQKEFSPQAYLRVVEALGKIAAGKERIPLLLEIAAGAGATLGVKFEELAFYLKQIPAIGGFCYDTAHGFASGYDIRDQEKFKKVFADIEKIIGKDGLKLIHINDSLADFESNVDRHAHIGAGKLGKKPFQYLVDYFGKKNYNVDMILETPTEEGLLLDIAFLKRLRANLKEKIL